MPIPQNVFHGTPTMDPGSSVGDSTSLPVRSAQAVFFVVLATNVPGGRPMNRSAKAVATAILAVAALASVVRVRVRDRTRPRTARSRRRQGPSEGRGSPGQRPAGATAGPRTSALPLAVLSTEVPAMPRKPTARRTAERSWEIRRARPRSPPATFLGSIGVCAHVAQGVDAPAPSATAHVVRRAFATSATTATRPPCRTGSRCTRAPGFACAC